MPGFAKIVKSHKAPTLESLRLRGGFKNMYGEEQCQTFSRGEAGTTLRTVEKCESM